MILLFFCCFDFLEYKVFCFVFLQGWGVKSKQPIKAGEFILEYVGEVVSEKEFKERMNSIYVNDTHHYCLHLDGGLVIDGHRMGGDGKINKKLPIIS